MTQPVKFASKGTPVTGVEGAEAALKRIERLEELAAWHRWNADRAGSAWIWDARLRTAEDLEQRAARLRALLLPDNNPAYAEPYSNRPAVTEEGKKILFGQTAAPRSAVAAVK